MLMLTQIHEWKNDGWVLVRMNELHVNSIFKMANRDGVYTAVSEPFINDGVWGVNSNKTTWESLK